VLASPRLKSRSRFEAVPREKNGGCSESSSWKLKLSEENSKIETEFEVDQNVVGDTARARNVDTDEVCRGKATW
jgi:hypothetical protein